jgi:hypothetical protein
MTKGHGIDEDGNLRSGAKVIGCKTTATWRKVNLSCHRSPDHGGSHLDADHDVWFSKDREGMMVFYPRRHVDTMPSARGRVTTTRKGT